MKQYLMIGDSISMGMSSFVFANVSNHNVEGVHNPGNAANANWGLHSLDCWTLPGQREFDVISFNFGLHGLAYDTERLDVQRCDPWCTVGTSVADGRRLRENDCKKCGQPTGKHATCAIFAVGRMKMKEGINSGRWSRAKKVEAIDNRVAA